MTELRYIFGVFLTLIMFSDYNRHLVAGMEAIVLYHKSNKKMKTNIGKLDQKARILFGALIAVTGIFFNSYWGLLSLVLIGSAISRSCPIYGIFGINTSKSKN